MADIKWDEPIKERMTFNITIETDENGDLDKIRLSDDWNQIENGQRIKIFSKMLNDLHFWVDLDEFTNIQIKYASDKPLREANRKIQEESQTPGFSPRESSEAGSHEPISPGN